MDSALRGYATATWVGKEKDATLTPVKDVRGMDNASRGHVIAMQAGRELGVLRILVLIIAVDMASASLGIAHVSKAGKA